MGGRVRERERWREGKEKGEKGRRVRREEGKKGGISAELRRQ